MANHSPQHSQGNGAVGATALVAPTPAVTSSRVGFFPPVVALRGKMSHFPLSYFPQTSYFELIYEPKPRLATEPRPERRISPQGAQRAFPRAPPPRGPAPPRWPRPPPAARAGAPPELVQRACARRLCSLSGASFLHRPRFSENDGLSVISFAFLIYKCCYCAADTDKTLPSRRRRKRDTGDRSPQHVGARERDVKVRAGPVLGSPLSQVLFLCQRPGRRDFCCFLPVPPARQWPPAVSCSPRSQGRPSSPSSPSALLLAVLLRALPAGFRPDAPSPHFSGPRVPAGPPTARGEAP